MRLKWMKALKREGYQPTAFSVVCSVHFSPESYEEVSNCGKKLRKIVLKRNAVPSIFSFSDIKTLMQALERKPEPKQKRKNPVVMKVRPACLGDGNPCCERENWENLPIVSKMCNKCVMSCRERYNPEEPGQIDALNTNKRQIRCDMCPFSASKKINLETHIKSVHLRGQFQEGDKNTQSNNEETVDTVSHVKTEPANVSLDKTEEKRHGTYQDNENGKRVRYGPKESQSGRQRKSRAKIPKEATMTYVKKSGNYRCDICPFPPFRAERKIDMDTHIKSVHLRARETTIFFQSNDDIAILKKYDDVKSISNDPLAANQTQDQTKDNAKRVTPAEATAALEMLGKFLMQNDINVDELLLHSQYRELVLSKVRNLTN